MAKGGGWRKAIREFCRDFAKLIREIASLIVLASGFTALDNVHPSPALSTLSFLCTAAIAMLVLDAFVLSDEPGHAVPADRPVQHVIATLIVVGGTFWASSLWMGLARDASKIIAEGRAPEIVEVKVYGPPLNATPVLEVKGTRI